jgi:hypothetical protein
VLCNWTANYERCALRLKGCYLPELHDYLIDLGSSQTPENALLSVASIERRLQDEQRSHSQTDIPETNLEDPLLVSALCS